MTKEELLAKLKTAKNKEYVNLCIEYNKLCGYYYHEAEWLTKVYNAIEYHFSGSLTGNELTKKLATELNKIDGVVLEEDFDVKTNTLNYFVFVVTPYTIYNYYLKRGYGNRCNFDKCKVGAMSRKARAVIRKADNIVELIYDATFEEIMKTYGRKILTKSNESLDVDSLLKEFDEYLAEEKAKREKQLQEEKADFDSFWEEFGIEFGV